jgi:lantibiotic modifying enzyme
LSNRSLPPDRVVNPYICDRHDPQKDEHAFKSYELSGTRVWRPLLLEDRARSGLACLTGIVGAYADEANGPSLGNGSAGNALFLAHLSRATNHEAGARTAAQQAENALVDAAGTSHPSLYAGVIGPAWVLSHLDKWVRHLNLANDEVDKALLALLENSPWLHDYDLINGLAGIGIYALSRLPNPEALNCLELVVEHLASNAETDSDGVTWFTRPELLPDWQRQIAPDGYYNLGMAHGVPGVISLLGNICAAGVANPTAARLLEGAVDWLLAQRCPSNAGPAFPAWVVPGGDNRPGPLFWCYGDPGVSSALLSAALGSARDDWVSEAVELALRVVSRTPILMQTDDAGICHGTAGLAHIFNRFWQVTGEDAFSASAKSLLERTAELLHNTTSRGFLEGSAGIGLVLLSALGSSPDWDAALGMSSPARKSR